MGDWVTDLGLEPDDAAALEAVAGEAGPVVLVNLFALREQATYTGGTDEPCSGGEALMRYAAVSGDRLAAVGGTFLHQGAATRTLWGDEEWDLVVVGRYPNGAAVLKLLQDPAYLEAYRHRRAAVSHQRIVVSPAFA